MTYREGEHRSKDEKRGSSIRRWTWQIFFVHFVDFFTERVCVQGQRPPVFNVSCKKLSSILAAQEF